MKASVYAIQILVDLHNFDFLVFISDVFSKLLRQKIHNEEDTLEDYFARRYIIRVRVVSDIQTLAFDSSLYI